MVFTSVSGHLLTHEFANAFRSWQSCNPEQLFEAPVCKMCPDNFVKIKNTLEREIRTCQGLIIWTDCDREGENIGCEIVDVCKAVKSNINIERAKFSDMTPASLTRAVNNLIRLDERVSQAVDVRSELDLRIGAAFTRFQTLRLQAKFPESIEDLVSYGKRLSSCNVTNCYTTRFQDHVKCLHLDLWLNVTKKLKISFQNLFGKLKVSFFLATEQLISPPLF